MPKVKLKTNVILADGKYLTRGSIVDEALLPPHLRDDAHVTRDLDHKEGKVMLLINLTYTTDEIDPQTGQRVGYPCSLARGEAVRLEEIPERQREDWREGVEYKRDWSEKERLLTRAKETESYMKRFQPDDLPLGIYDN